MTSNNERTVGEIGVTIEDLNKLVEGVALANGILEWPDKASHWDKIAILVEHLDKEVTKLLHRNASLKFEQDRGVIERDKLEQRLAIIKTNRDRMYTTVERMCDIALEAQVTHGQKNGMFVMIRDFVAKCARPEYDALDIPF